jgi:hypothetical protein
MNREQRLPRFLGPVPITTQIYPFNQVMQESAPATNFNSARFGGFFHFRG